jgi:phosphate uptake regulator
MMILLDDTELQLLDRAIALHGVNFTGDQAIEACARMITTLFQYSRSEVRAETLAEAMARVHITLAQLSRFTGDEPVQRALRLQLSDLKNHLDDLSTALRERNKEHTL